MTREDQARAKALQHYLDLQLEAYATTYDFDSVVAGYALLSAHAAAGDLGLASTCIRLMAESALAEERSKRNDDDALPRCA